MGRSGWTYLGAAIALALVLLVALIMQLTQSPQSVSSRVGDPTRYVATIPELLSEPWGSDPVGFYVSEYVDNLTTEEAVRSLLVLNYPGTDARTLENYLTTYRPGGFILMGSNIPATPEELAALTGVLRSSEEFPRLVGIDQEGGVVSRLPYDSAAGANVLRFEPVGSTIQAFSQRSALLESLGINLNFGIVGDISADPTSFIYSRSFGGDPQSASERVEAAVLAETSVLSTVKHFPGHGSAPGDSHVGIPISPLSYDQWLTTEAVPFIKAISANVPVVMFGHLSFPAVDSQPSSLSPTWHNILRNDLGFDGIIITDDMTMLENSGNPEYADPGTNAVRALGAGADVLLYVPAVSFNPDTVVQAVLSAIDQGILSEAAIRESVGRVATERRLMFAGAQTWVPPCDERCFIRITY